MAICTKNKPIHLIDFIYMALALYPSNHIDPTFPDLYQWGNGSYNYNGLFLLFVHFSENLSK